MTKEKKRVGIIVFYFGKFPWYHQFFIESCRRNESMHFFIFSDQFSKDEEVANISQISFSLARFNELASEKLGFLVNISSGLKICDLRPAFGIIFQDYLKSFDYWGYSDTDIIFGNFADFYTDEFLDLFDFFSVVQHYPSGFFAIFRNTALLNNLFRSCDQFEDVVNFPSNTLFEECGGYYNEVIAGQNILNTECEFYTLHHLLDINQKSIRASFLPISFEDSFGHVKWDGKSLTLFNRPIFIFHLTKLKDNLFFKTPVPSLSKKNFMMLRQSIREHTCMGYIAGKAYDFYCAVSMRVRVFLDSHAKREIESLNFEGTFFYMRIGFEILKTERMLAAGNSKFPLYRSVCFKNMLFAHGLQIYILPEIDLGRVKVIYHDGTVRNFQLESQY